MRMIHWLGGSFKMFHLKRYWLNGNIPQILRLKKKFETTTSVKACYFVVRFFWRNNAILMLSHVFVRGVFKSTSHHYFPTYFAGTFPTVCEGVPTKSKSTKVWPLIVGNPWSMDRPKDQPPWLILDFQGVLFIWTFILGDGMGVLYEYVGGLLNTAFFLHKLLVLGWNCFKNMFQRPQDKCPRGSLVSNDCWDEGFQG